MMKRTIAIALTTALTVFAFSAPAFAQSAEGEAAVAVGERYEVRSQLGEDDARMLARELDLRFAAYDMLFRFDPSVLSGKLKVRAFKDKEAYDSYLKAALGDTREEAVYLHYGSDGRGGPDNRSELVLLRDGAHPTGKIFAHQAFIQYLRTFIPNPPAWIREGFASYFEGLGYDAKKDELTYEENLAWLETVKSWGKTGPSLSSVMLADVQGEETIDRTKLSGASWALASFLLNGEGEGYRRTLYEIFMLLDPASSAADNARRVAERAAAWINPETAKKDIEAYLALRKSFPELIEDGRAAYAAKQVDKAEQLFLSAAETRPTHYAPHYYLGLLAYERKDYALAENYYRTAEQLGADAALVNYALGVNAAADGRKADAIGFLEKAKAAAPARYAAKADELIARLK